MATSKTKCCGCKGCIDVIPYWTDVKNGEKHCGLYPFFVISGYADNLFDPNCADGYALGTNWDGKLPAYSATCEYYYESVANKIINGRHFWWAFMRRVANIWTYTITGISGGAVDIWTGAHAADNLLPTDAPFVRVSGCSATPTAIAVVGRYFA